MSLDEMTDHLARLEMQAEFSGFSFAAHLIGVACAALKEEAALAPPSLSR